MRKLVLMLAVLACGDGDDELTNAPGNSPPPDVVGSYVLVSVNGQEAAVVNWQGTVELNEDKSCALGWFTDVSPIGTLRFSTSACNYTDPSESGLFEIDVTLGLMLGSPTPSIAGPKPATSAGNPGPQIETLQAHFVSPNILEVISSGVTFSYVR